ncbi:DUF732 domain-containing protein [Phycicoccus sonneratiae]
MPHTDPRDESAEVPPPVPPVPPAGWHADPSEPRQWRFWDGALWTEHTHPISSDQPILPQADLAQNPTAEGTSGQSQHRARSRTRIALLVAGGLCLLVVAVGWAGAAVLKSHADGAFLEEMHQDPGWSGFGDEEAELLVEFGRGVCEGFDNGMDGVEVYATLVNSIGTANDPDGIPAQQVSSLMDHAIAAYCPARANLWTDH